MNILGSVFNHFFINSCCCFRKKNKKVKKYHKSKNEEIINSIFHDHLLILNKILLKPTRLKKVIELNGEISRLEIIIDAIRENLLNNSSEDTVLVNPHLNSTFHEDIQRLQFLKDLYRQQVAFHSHHLPTAEQEQYSTIFAIEYQFRKALEIDFSNKQKYQEIYDQKILPLVAQTKSMLKSLPNHFSNQAAAAKGKGLQAGLSVIINLTQDNGMVSDKTDSSQQVFLFPKEGAVFKKSDKIAKEEERLASALFDLMSKEAVVGAYEFNSASKKQFGIEVSSEFVKRGFTPDALFPAFRQKLLMKLSLVDVQILKAYEKKNQQDGMLKAYIIPHFNHSSEKEAYEICEKHQWKYIDKDGFVQTVNFKTYQALFIADEVMQNVEVVSTHNTTLPSSEQIQKALNVGWKIVSPELLTRSRDREILDLKNVYAKPFVKEMMCLSELDDQLRNSILQRLTEDSQFNAILTAEIQLLDLHAENLGVQPELNAEFAYYENFQFTLFPDKTRSFKELLSDYLKELITSDTIITFEEQGGLISKPLKELPKLQKALNVHWKLVIFDMDVCLSEDNRLHEVTFKNANGHLIPLRSVFLETGWKHQPLSSEVIQRLLQSDERDVRVQQWISKEDAPIYKHLTEDVKKNIQKLVQPLIQKLSLSRYKKRKMYPTVSELAAHFASELSKMDQPCCIKIWETLEAALLKKCDLTSSDSQAVNRRKKIALQLFPRLTSAQQKALVERQQNRKKYLENYLDLSKSVLQGPSLLMNVEQFLKEPSTPLTSLRKTQLLQAVDQLKKDSVDDHQILADFKDMICNECQPTYFNLAKAMYPFLADAFELNQILFETEIERGAYIGMPNMTMEAIIAKIKNTSAVDSVHFNLADNFGKRMALANDYSFFTSFY